MAMQKFLENDMTRNFGSTGLEKFLIPTYAVGCTRPTPGVGYLEAPMSENTVTVLGEREHIEMDGIIDGTSLKHDLNTIICTIGFDLSYKLFKTSGLT